MVGIIIYLLTKKTNFKNTSIVIMGIAMSALFDAGIQYFNISNYWKYTNYYFMVNRKCMGEVLG